MGGDPGNRPHSGFFGGRSSSDGCDIQVTTTLQSTRPSILNSVSINDEFSIELHPNITSRTVGCIDFSTGVLIGTISIAQQAALIKCLAAEIKYRAKVVLKEGGRCDVRIRRYNS